jgi:hypothetical protein
MFQGSNKATKLEGYEEEQEMSVQRKLYPKLNVSFAFALPGGPSIVPISRPNAR